MKHFSLNIAINIFLRIRSKGKFNILSIIKSILLYLPMGRLGLARLIHFLGIKLTRKIKYKIIDKKDYVSIFYSK